MAVAITVTRERRDGETRCAVTPETVKKLIALGATVAVEAGTGAGSAGAGGAASAAAGGDATSAAGVVAQAASSEALASSSAIRFF